jgi:transposase InsO family protein
LIQERLGTHNFVVVVQNGFVESFHGKLRDECLDQETFLTIREAQICLEKHRRFYNEVRPHSALGYQTPKMYKQKWDEKQRTKHQGGEQEVN